MVRGSNSKDFGNPSSSPTASWEFDADNWLAGAYAYVDDTKKINQLGFVTKVSDTSTCTGSTGSSGSQGTSGSQSTTGSQAEEAPAQSAAALSATMGVYAIEGIVAFALSFL